MMTIVAILPEPRLKHEDRYNSAAAGAANHYGLTMT
jgi:hypothetical protein